MEGAEHEMPDRLTPVENILVYSISKQPAYAAQTRDMRFQVRITLGHKAPLELLITPEEYSSLVDLPETARDSRMLEYVKKYHPDKT